MSAPALVLDVVPPPDLPPVRPRSRLGSGLLVALVLGLVTSLSLVMAPPAKAWAPILIPVAQTLGATAVAGLAGEGVKRLFVDGTEDTGGDDEDSKNKRGKWGNKLKGLPGLAVGLLGGLWGTTEAVEMLRGEGDGVDMPAELTEDLTKENLGANYGGTYARWKLDESSFKFVQAAGYKGLMGPAVSIRGACAKLGSGSVNFCPTNSETPQSVGFAYFNCFDPATGGWRVLSVTLIVNGQSEPGCNTGGTRPESLPYESVILRQPSSSQSHGLDRAYKFPNPDFDWSMVDGALPTQGAVTAEVQCTEVGTGNKQTLTKSVAASGGVIPLAQCPTGWAPESIGWTETAPGGGAPEYLGGLKPATPAAYPNCPPGECVRIVKVDGQPCNALRPECFDWMNTQPPTRVQCEFGPYNMPIAECADLEHIHKSTHGVTWGPNPETGTPQWLPAREDGTIDKTRVGTVYAPEDNPNREYRPPVQGPLIQIGGEPSNPPSTAPVPPPPSVPPPVVNPPGGPKDVEDGTKNCIAGMASWNPVDWVYTPVKCALTWAFVPKNGTGGDLFNDFVQKFTDGGIGPWLAVPPMLFEDLPQGGGCQGPPLTMPETLGGKTYYPLNACSDPMAKYANMSRSLITVVVVFYGMFSVINSLTTSLTGYRMFERESAQVTKGMT